MKDVAASNYENIQKQFKISNDLIEANQILVANSAQLTTTSTARISDFIENLLADIQQKTENIINWIDSAVNSALDRNYREARKLAKELNINGDHGGDKAKRCAEKFKPLLREAKDKMDYDMLKCRELLFYRTENFKSEIRSGMQDLSKATDNFNDIADNCSGLNLDECISNSMSEFRTVVENAIEFAETKIVQENTSRNAIDVAICIKDALKFFNIKQREISIYMQECMMEP